MQQSTNQQTTNRCKLLKWHTTYTTCYVSMFTLCKEWAVTV